MPCKNVVKRYMENGIYHIYNRGVEKRIIFMDKTDELVFYKYLTQAINRYNILLIKYSLRSNHFHILIKQSSKRSMERLMRSLCTRYACYFNYKYQRVGSLFQGTYRARIINTDSELKIIKDYIDNQYEV